MVDIMKKEFSEEDKFVAYSMPGTTDHLLLSGGYIGTEKTHSFVISSFLKNKINYTPSEIDSNLAFSFRPKRRIESTSTLKAKYLQDVDIIINDIKAKKYEKLVYSRISTSERPDQDVYDTFLSLKNQYPMAFVFCYHFPERGTWMGATPELLVQEESNTYKTMALAGTQLDLGIALDQVQWGEKERAEQDFIVQFVEDKLRKIGAHWQKSSTDTVKAADVLHLCTTFSIDSDSIEVKTLADVLHPSPAICGLPQDITKQRIADLEGHSREDYCGYLGPIGIGGESALFVNLRSMKIYADGYELFLGGGITSESDPIKEWKETEDKSRTLLKIISEQYSV